MRPIGWLVLFVTFLFFFGLATAAFAGGGGFEAPLVIGRCQPTVVPEDLKGEGWRWIKVHERRQVSLGKNQIQSFQVLSCIEFNKDGSIAREYMIAAEWWRPRK